MKTDEYSFPHALALGYPQTSGNEKFHCSGINKETCLILLITLGTANSQLFLLMSKLPSEWDTRDKTLRCLCCPASGKLLSLFYKERHRGSERFRNWLGSHSQEMADLGLSHCSQACMVLTFSGLSCSLEGIRVLRQGHITGESAVMEGQGPWEPEGRGSRLRGTLLTGPGQEAVGTACARRGGLKRRQP